MAKTKTRYTCGTCGYIAPQHMGRCPECESWNSFNEVIEETKPTPTTHRGMHAALADNTPQILSDIPVTDHTTRFSTGFPELDRVLGGGLVPGSYMLFGGDPGIGKSTLMLQLADKVAQAEKTVLYVGGEESPQQIKLRAQRLGVTGNRILIYPETNLYHIEEEIKKTRPDVAIIDSIQSIYNPDLTGIPGNPSQMKDCAGHLMTLAKALNITILLVGHVTKEGTVSGPKLLEHTVDGVLFFEGEKFRNLRILRAIKNRFGNTNEIGIFEMGERGLAEVANPSELFLSEHCYHNNPGSVIVSTMEGNRPLLIEIQALVGFSTYASPCRVTNGFDTGRLHQIVAVLERRLGMDFSKQDIYINVVGGLRIQEPAADLGIALALITSSRDIPCQASTVVTGELGLTGEVRPISHLDARIAEAAKLGFQRIVIPKSRQPSDTMTLHGIEQLPIETLMEAIPQCLDKATAFNKDKHTDNTEHKGST